MPVWVDVTTTNSIMAFDLFLRVQPQSGPIRPYMDLLGGFNLLSTSTSIEDQGWDDDDDIASSNNFNDAAWGWGSGGGLMIRVYDGVSRGPARTAWTRFQRGPGHPVPARGRGGIPEGRLHRSPGQRQIQV
ncbi:MAG: hypothetical protein MZV49_00500 [Rhodopseudomonas palustris]|nr:hypothetical protein [Rhodopseudomonas palustris]